MPNKRKKRIPKRKTRDEGLAFEETAASKSKISHSLRSQLAKYIEKGRQIAEDSFAGQGGQTALPLSSF